MPWQPSKESITPKKMKPRQRGSGIYLSSYLGDFRQPENAKLGQLLSTPRGGGWSR